MVGHEGGGVDLLLEQMDAVEVLQVLDGSLQGLHGDILIKLEGWRKEEFEVSILVSSRTKLINDNKGNNYLLDSENTCIYSVFKCFYIITPVEVLQVFNGLLQGLYGEILIKLEWSGDRKSLR